MLAPLPLQTPMLPLCLLLLGSSLTNAYDALKVRDYDRAIAAFHAALRESPDQVAVRKDLAYTLLKTGDTEAARDQFAEVLRANPNDFPTALEYAYLCYETRREADARRTFDRVRQHGDPASRAAAQQAFDNIDVPLSQGIARWQKALESDPSNFSAHEELAILAERRDDLSLAASHYDQAWHLRLARRDMLLALGRVWQKQGKNRESIAVLLSVSRGSEPRLAEQAHALLPNRYPYPYEFQDALKYDPGNAALAQELGYLLEAMGQKKPAAAAPKPPPPPDPVEQARQLAEASLAKSYLNDAIKYLLIVQQANPDDAQIQLKLARTYNLLHQDPAALVWFDKARRSSDREVAREASIAYHNLRPELAPFRVTTWVMPFYSSRWQDTFAYGQVKGEFRLRNLKLRPYLSVRFIGDTGGNHYTGVLPAQLSENSFILAGGLSLPITRRLFAWGEAGQAVRYKGQFPNGGITNPDYRGGLAYSRGWGHLLGSREPGWFAETTGDAVYISQFQNDGLFVSHNRIGRTLAPWLQLLWNTNLSADVHREYWANLVEMGPGLEFSFAGMPPGLRCGFNYLHGVYLINQGNPLRPNYNDLRAGCWYAFTH